MPTLIDIQSLVGNFVAIAAALIGFWGVIYSQRKLARMAHDERVHSERMAKEQTERERRDELESLINAMVGELSATQLNIASAIQLLQAQVSIAEELARQGMGRKTQPRVVFKFETPVFDSHVSRIGLLKPDLSFKVSYLFVQLKSFSKQSQDQVPEMDPVLAQRIMRSVEETLRKLQKDAEELKNQLNAGTVHSN